MSDGLGIDDQNKVLIEGTVGRYFAKQENNGRFALNFAIECRKHSKGVDKVYKHNVVIFDNNLIEKYEKHIRTGAFIKAEGHLISQVKEINGQPFEFSKPCIDYLQIEEM